MEGQVALSEAEWLRGVVRDFEQPLTRYALSLTRDVERALDAVQETFLELVRSAGRVDRGRPAPWLFTVCRTKAVDAARRESRMDSRTQEELARRESEVAGPEEVAQSHEEAQEAARLLGLLPAKEQEVVRLKFQEKLRYREIAEVTGLSVSHVGVLIHTAMERLRKEIDESKGV